MKKGFTLIELLVVVLIIGILAAVALPQYQMAVEKARLTEAFAMVSSLEKSIDVWLLEHGTPTEDTGFFGDEANGKGQLDINIENGMDCSINGGGECGNKNFSYEAGCATDGSCWLYVRRWLNSNVAYMLNHYKDSVADAWRPDECDYYTDEGNIGEKICKWLANTHGYAACEDC